MKVLVADLFSEDGIKEMKDSGIEIIYDDKLNGDSLKKALADHQPTVLVVRSTKLTSDIIDAGTKLQLIIRAGAGVDTIDVAHAAKQGIYVANCPGKNADAVAELTFGLILCIDRRLAEGVQLFREGKWNKGMFVNSIGIKGRTIGLIGFGSIAQSVARMALAFGMHVLVHTRTKKQGLDEELGFEYAESLEDLLKKSDIVSVHIPNTPETKGMINKEFLKNMKSDAVLINTARGTVANDEHLIAHLEENKDFWYGTDVYNGEPSVKEGPFENVIAKHPRVYGSHHIGASTKQAETAIGDEAVRIVKKFAKTGAIDLENTVNRASDA